MAYSSSENESTEKTDKEKFAEAPYTSGFGVTRMTRQTGFGMVYEASSTSLFGVTRMTLQSGYRVFSEASSMSSFGVTDAIHENTGFGMCTFKKKNSCVKSRFKFGHSSENTSTEKTYKEMFAKDVSTSDSNLRIVMIGKTGVGKRAVGNTILGEKKFVSYPNSESVTVTCETGETQWEGRKISVIDTPGILDTKKSPDITKKEIVRCVEVSSPGPHVFLLVIQVGRFTTEEKNSVEALQELFGPKANYYMIVLFTHGDDLEDQEITIQQYLRESKPELRQVVQSCGNRFHVFDNKSQDRRQVEELIKKIDDMVAGNGDTYYTNAMYREVEERKQKQADREEEEYEFMNQLLEQILRFYSLLNKE